MKTNFRLIAAAALAFTLAFAGCSKDSEEGTEGGNTNPKGEGYTQLTIWDTNKSKTRAATDTENTIPVEDMQSTTLAVYIFNANGAFEYGNPTLGIASGAGDTRVTDPFLITSGQKYIYIFSELPASFAPNTMMNRAGFEKQIIAAGIATDRPMAIATDNKFIIGTLWAEPTTVAGTGTAATPENVTVQVGRVASKIRVEDVVYTNKSNGVLKGTFSNAIFRVRSVATELYVAGQRSGTPGNYTYEAALHNEPPTVGGVQNPKFVSYPWEATSNIGTKDYYIVENTSAKIGGEIYYGNTTYVQFSVVYNPVAADLCAADGTPWTGSVSAGMTFWTAVVNGITYMYAELPTVTPDPGTEVKRYINGVNYYKHPVMDDTEAGVVNKCVVLRNHVYELDVTGFSQLGEPTDTVDPETPIPDEYELEVTVKILPWSKVYQSIDF